MTFAIPTTPPTTATQPPTTLQDNLRCISIAQTKCMNEIANFFLRTLLPAPGPLIPHSDALARLPSRKKLRKRRWRLFISMSMDVCWFAGLENSTHFGGGFGALELTPGPEERLSPPGHRRPGSCGRRRGRC